MPSIGSKHLIFAPAVALLLAALFVLPAARGQEEEAPYAEPDFEKQIFLREAVLLESQEVTEIVTALAALASNFSDGDGITNRLRAKALAVALNLDGVDPTAVRANLMLKGGKVPPIVDGFATLGKIARTIWGAAGYLESPEKGRNELILQYCLADIAREIDPSNGDDSRRFPLTISENLFAGWDPILGTSPGPEIDFPPGGGATDPEAPAPLSEIDLEGTKEAEGKIRAAVVNGGEPEETEIYGELSLRSGNAPLAIVFTDKEGDIEQPLNRQRATIVSALTETHDGQWPKNSGVIVLRVEAGRTGDRNLTLPAAILADSLIRGQEVNADALAIGIVAPEGSLIPPGNLWQRLDGLETRGAVVILPEDCLPELQDMLLLREFDMFFDHQIITAATLEEAVEIASGERSEKFDLSLNKFRQVQNLTNDNTPEVLSGYEAVHTRLEEVLTSIPKHASASLLLKHAKGELPKTLTRKGSLVALARATQEVVTGMQDRENSGILSDPSVAKKAGIELEKIDGLMHSDAVEICGAMVVLVGDIADYTSLASKSGESAEALRAKIDSAWEVVRSEFQQLMSSEG